MRTETAGQRLRIYLGEQDKHGGQPLYEAIVLQARASGLAGATVLRGPMGFGTDARLHSAKILRLSEDLPVIVEIVDRTERIERFLGELEPLLAQALATVEPVRILRYGASF